MPSAYLPYGLSLSRSRIKATTKPKDLETINLRLLSLKSTCPTPIYAITVEINTNYPLTRFGTAEKPGLCGSGESFRRPRTTTAKVAIYMNIVFQSQSQERKFIYAHHTYPPTAYFRYPEGNLKKAAPHLCTGNSRQPCTQALHLSEERRRARRYLRDFI